MVAVGVPSRTLNESVANEKRGAPSRIRSSAVPKLPSTAPPVGFVSDKIAERSPVAVPSPRTVTVKVFDVWPAPKLSVPDVAV